MLKSVTLYPAEILGVADRMGSIDTGKIANIVVADGDMLGSANPHQVPLYRRSNATATPGTRGCLIALRTARAAR
jgi:imidazolonepropionase-like amidohydrolase